jgi:hypothetical protein
MAAPATLADPGRVRSLRWRPDAALLAAAATLRRALDAWAAAWGLSLHGVQARNAVPGDAPAPSVQQHLLASGAARLWQADGAAPTALSTLLFGAPPADARAGSALADELASSAWQDLLDAVAVAVPVAGSASPAGTPDHAERAWSGALRVDFAVRNRGAESRFCLRLDAALADAWCASAASTGAARPVVPRTPAVALAAVVADRPVRVSVHLAAVELNLGALQSLAVGDVIRLPHRLDEALQVNVDLDETPSRTPLCRAHLAQKDGRLVAELTPGPAVL